MKRIAVGCKDISGDVVAGSHRLQGGGVRSGDGPELRVIAAIVSQRGNGTRSWIIQPSWRISDVAHDVRCIEAARVDGISS